MANTYGQAVDAAIARHERLYPESAIYSACVGAAQLKEHHLEVEIRASHFSVPLRYLIRVAAA